MPPSEHDVPDFFNIQVVVTRPNSTTNPLTYQVLYYKDGKPLGDSGVTARRRNTIINYQLIEPTPDEIRFSGMSRKDTESEHQISPYAISPDGKMLTFCDATSKRTTINVTLYWTDGIPISDDPEIINKPEIHL